MAIYCTKTFLHNTTKGGQTNQVEAGLHLQPLKVLPITYIKPIAILKRTLWPNLRPQNITRDSVFGAPSWCPILVRIMRHSLDP